MRADSRFPPLPRHLDYLTDEILSISWGRDGVYLWARCHEGSPHPIIYILMLLYWFSFIFFSLLFLSLFFISLHLDSRAMKRASQWKARWMTFPSHTWLTLSSPRSGSREWDGLERMDGFESIFISSFVSFMSLRIPSVTEGWGHVEMTRENGQEKAKEWVS